MQNEVKLSYFQPSYLLFFLLVSYEKQQISSRRGTDHRWLTHTLNVQGHIWSPQDSSAAYLHSTRPKRTQRQTLPYARNIPEKKYDQTETGAVRFSQDSSPSSHQASHSRWCHRDTQTPDLDKLLLSRNKKGEINFKAEYLLRAYLKLWLCRYVYYLRYGDSFHPV